jgi:uncharacterized protein (TIGR02266 family)
MATSAGARAKTVVVADDTAFVRDRFRTALEDGGHRVMTVRTAAELVQTIRTDLDRIDLIIVDLRLPNASGLELLRSIRKVDGGRLPVLVFSGTIASAEEVRALTAMGVAGYINEYSAVPHILPSLAPHLFPDAYQHRRGPRMTLGVSIAYRFGNTIAAALTSNLSRHGVAIRTTSPLEPGMPVRLRFKLPGARRETEAQGTVVWSDRRVGMGLRFDVVSPADQQAIDEFIERHFFTNRKA